MVTSDRFRHNSNSNSRTGNNAGTQQLEDRMLYDPASDSGRNYVDEPSEIDFVEIQPEDSASHQGDNSFVYQR